MKEPLRIPDNSECSLASLGALEADVAELQRLANRSVGELVDENADLLVFPPDLRQTADKIETLSICSLTDDTLRTGNLMGFVGVNDVQLNIHSRFAQSDADDHFLHHMLLRVFAPNLVDFPHSDSQEPIFDFLIYLFPHYLRQALRQGLFKQYQRMRYNDTNVRGPVDVSRHLRENVPFRGRVSYSTREHRFDNPLTQLIRHTIEHIRGKAADILRRNADVQADVAQVVAATPTYNARERQRVVAENLRPLRHPYFLEYVPLQRLCLQILRHESIKYGRERDRVYGILFDGAWLWEEYLATILKGEGLTHAENKVGARPVYVFQEPRGRALYPDFYRKTDPPLVLDAKYKWLDSDVRNIDRDDLHQMLAYMYLLKAVCGEFVYPTDRAQELLVHNVRGYGGAMATYGFCVPQADFKAQILQSEAALRTHLQTLLDGSL